MNNSNFIKTIIKEDLESKKHDSIITRFPPEPNGYLHIGHAKAIITNFELAKEFNGAVNLRFDDTNPAKESQEYVNSIQEDVKWLGYEWDNLFFASDYFQEMYDRAILLIKKGLAYVCDLSFDEAKQYKGDFKNPGKNSPFRERTVEENLELFIAMKDGKYKDGEKVLRAKIDMASPNINLRDPVIYRIMHVEHHNSGNKWCIYPMYDYAHPLEDAIEGITHSLCTIEFEDHRPLYDWYVKNCEMEKTPRQIEFGRLSFRNTVTSKRYLLQLVTERLVTGWDDPRMPTLRGMRRRGYTSSAIRECILNTGLSKAQGTADIENIEHFVRNDLIKRADRLHAIKNPLKVIITNYDENSQEELQVHNNKDRDESTRTITFSNEIYIDRDDFIEEKPNKKWKRLALGVEVRLMGAYFIKANKAVKDDNGIITHIEATYDPQTKSNTGFNERKPNGNIQFVNAKDCVNVKLHDFESLFSSSDSSLELKDRLNPNSEITYDAVIESSIKNYDEDAVFQFVRMGYYKLDNKQNFTVFQTVGLKSQIKN